MFTISYVIQYSSSTYITLPCFQLQIILLILVQAKFVWIVSVSRPTHFALSYLFGGPLFVFGTKPVRRKVENVWPTSTPNFAHNSVRFANYNRSYYSMFCVKLRAERATNARNSTDIESNQISVKISIHHSTAKFTQNAFE